MDNNSLPFITVDVKTLPSRGMGLPDGSVLKYRTYSFGEVKNNSVQSAMSIITSLENVMSGLDTEGTFNKYDITFVDAIYLGILRKVSTMNGLECTVPYHCEACNKKNEAKFTETSIEFKDISEEVTSLPIKTELGGVPVEFMPLTVQDFLDIERGKYDRWIKDKKQDRVSLYAAMIKNMKFDQAYNLIYNLQDQDDVELIETIDTMLTHDLKEIEHTCTAVIEEENKRTCNHVNKIRLEGREALIRPFREGERPAKNKLRFGRE